MELDQGSRRRLARQFELRRALRFGEPQEAARAASRVRVAGVELPTHELDAARSSRASLGRAVREARFRASATRVALQSPVVRRSVGTDRGRGPVGLALAAYLSLLILMLLMINLAQEPPAAVEDPGGAPITNTAALPTDVSRGRTDETTIIAIAEPTPEPSPEPAQSETPSPSATVIPLGAGGRGGAGGGTGSGIGTGSGPGVASPTATPAATSSPTPTPVPSVASGLTRISGRVVDSATGAGVPGVCLVPGSLDCAPSKPHSDANGFWFIDVTAGVFWDIRFEKDGYRVSRIRVYAGRREINVGNVRIVRLTPTPTPSPATPTKTPSPATPTPTPSPAT